MSYKVGDRVRITEDRDDVKKGTLGTVTQPVPDGRASWVKFDKPEVEVLIPDRILEPAKTKSKVIRTGKTRAKASRQ
jgi:hypothetical protein